MSFSDNIKFSIKNEISEIAVLRESLSAFYSRHGFSAKMINGLNLAIDEILTNIISYGFSDKNRHEISVSVTAGNAEVLIEIKDDGWQFNPLEAPPPDVDMALDDRPLGGLGIFLVKKLMDSIEYKHEEGRNILVMKKVFHLN